MYCFPEPIGVITGVFILSNAPPFLAKTIPVLKMVTGVFCLENRCAASSHFLQVLPKKSVPTLAVSSKISNDRMAILKKIQFRIQSVLKGRDSKYILLNAPNDKLDAILALLPGMRSPTVLPLAEKGWSSVHTVISKNQFWEIIDELKLNGAEGILVCPIEKMVV